MKLDIKKAFNSPFSEENWYIKFIFPFIMSILSIMSSVFYKDDSFSMTIANLLAFVPGIILGGFYAQFAHNEIHDISPLLPNLQSEIGNFLKYGFKLMGVMLIYFSVAIIGGLLGIIALKNPSILTLLALILMLGGLILGFVLSVAAEGIFFDNFCFKDTLDYKRVLKLLSKVKMEIAVYFLFCFCFIMLTSICNSIVEALNFTLLFAAALIATGQFIIVNISAQIYKIAKARLE